MANPEIKTCTAGEWTLVAEEVTSGFVHPLDAAQFLHTYRSHGGTAPTTIAEGAPLPQFGAAISALATIDVYIWCTGPADGKVRVDL